MNEDIPDKLIDDKVVVLSWSSQQMNRQTENLKSNFKNDDPFTFSECFLIQCQDSVTKNILGHLIFLAEYLS